MGYNTKNISLVIAIICMLTLLISCGGGNVTDCRKLNGTYWRSRDTLGRSNYTSYHDQIGLIRFNKDSIYSGQTGKGMAYTSTEKEGHVGNMVSFKLDDNGVLTISVITINVPFLQISKEEYNSLLEQNEIARKKKKYNS